MATVTVKFVHTSKARNSTKVPSTDVSTETVCYLKDRTSIIKQKINVQG